MNTRSKLAIAMTLAVVCVPVVASAKSINNGNIANSELWTNGNGSVWVDTHGNPVRTIHYNAKRPVPVAQAQAQAQASVVPKPAPEPAAKPVAKSVLEPAVTPWLEPVAKPVAITVLETKVNAHEKPTKPSLVIAQKATQKPKLNYSFNNYQTTVLFDTDSALLSPSAMGNLKQLIMASNLAHSVVSVQVVGHADTRGDAAYNMSLSQERMHNVAKFLNGMKLKVSSMFAKGETSPVLNNQGEDLTKSRRVHVLVKTRHIKD